MRTVRVPGWAPGDLVPVTERLRNLLIWRVAVLPLAALAVVLVPGLRVVDARPVAAAVGAFVLASAAVTVSARRVTRRASWLARGLLLADVVAVVALSLGVGGTSSPLRYVVVLQAVEATLLASFRTGLKVVAWQSLVVSGLYVVGPKVFGDVATVRLADAGRHDVAVLVACSWVAAMSTAWLAAANERELRRRRYDLEQLAAYHGRLEEATDDATAAEIFVTMTREELDVRRVLVALPDKAGDSLRVVAAGGLDRVPEELALVDGSILAEAVEAARTVLVAGLDPLLDAQLVEGLPATANIAALPLRTTRGHGAILVEPGLRTGSRVEKRVVSMLERYRDELSAQMSNLQLIDSLRISATTDPLTGAANRGRLREVLHGATQAAIRTGQPLCIAMLDVDHFKKVNDTHGHAAGDQVLKQVASTLQYHVRPYDTVARYGGEEFVVVLPATDLEDAVAVAERLREAIPAGTNPVSVTSSFGVTRFDPATDDGDRLVEKADALLYAAKQNGRNRVMTAERRALLPPKESLPPPER